MSLMSRRGNSVHPAQIMRLGDVQSVVNSNFNASWPVKMFLGGWPGYYACVGNPPDNNACYGEPIRDGCTYILLSN